MIWVAITNTNNCRIYEYDKKNSKLSLLKEINYPENKLKKRDYFTSDKPGHNKSGNNRGAYSQETDPKEAEIDVFSKEIADALDHGRKADFYQQLIIVTAPHMDGLLFQHLSKYTKNLITHNIQKNIQNLSEHELIQFLKVHTQFPN